MPSKKTEPRKCLQCGCDFLISKTDIKRGYGKYCSRPCVLKVKRAKSKKCLICSEYFYGENKYYCSNKCRAVWMSRKVGPDSPSWKGGVKATRLRAKAKSPEKFRAYKKLRKAVKKGKVLRRKSCSKCEMIGDIHAHHPDYSKPLEVVWLCRKCHQDEHRKIF